MGDVETCGAAEVPAHWPQFLGAQLRVLLNSDRLYPWDLWELHNPWSRSAARADSWEFLEICESEALLSAVAERLGPDLVLFDSLIVPNPALPAECVSACPGTAFFPVEPAGGISVRIPFSADPGDAPVTRLLFRKPEEEPAGAAMTAAVGPFEYVIRYFPAGSRYLRDAAHPAQRRLCEALPWINYATMPLWLVRGQDRAGNDFATGFRPEAGRWTAAR